jgi:hypothetical protein
MFPAVNRDFYSTDRGATRRAARWFEDKEYILCMEN